MTVDSLFNASYLMWRYDSYVKLCEHEFVSCLLIQSSYMYYIYRK